MPLFFALILSGCLSPKDKIKRATLLEVSNASEAQLVDQVNYLARVDSLRAKMYLKFEDNSFAELGIAEKYKTADGVLTVQRPANILMKVKVPFIKTDVAQMSSNGKRFCVAILQDGGSGKFRKFLCGSNNADYTLLKEKVGSLKNGDSETLTKNVNAFSNLRPQHFTEALLVRPVDRASHEYTVSTILQEEFDINAKKKSPVRWVLRGYYLLDEYSKNYDGRLKITRRFWFDRVGGIRLARQQIFDRAGEIESDIVYGSEGALTSKGEYTLPLRIEVTRPKEKYKMRLTYQTPRSVLIGRKFPAEAFELKNRWELEEVDLDKKLTELLSSQPARDGNQKATTGKQ